MLAVRTGETVTDRITGLHHLVVADEQRHALVAVGAVEDQVTRKSLLRQHLAADGVLRSGRPGQLDSDAGEGVQHETGSVETDDARGRVQSDDAALRGPGRWRCPRAAAAGRPVGVAAPERERHAALGEGARDHYWTACWLLSGRVMSAFARPGVANNTARPSTKA